MSSGLAMTGSAHRKWWVLGSLWTLYASFGLVAGSLAPLLSHIRVELNMSHAAMGAALGAWPFVYLAVSAIAGKLLDRYGLRVGLAAGSVLIGASGLLRALAQSGSSLWLAVAVSGSGARLFLWERPSSLPNGSPQTSEDLRSVCTAQLHRSGPSQHWS